ncbi:MAG TPA: hypothetical protein VD996_16255 [Chitinophagaceae bacterium]|nr:hypothetical protein [Chitinophagaceae bacterium]
MAELKDQMIPPQEEGTETNTEQSKELDTPAQAKEFYLLVKQRLLNVNDWEKLCGAGSADFTLTDQQGTEADRAAQQHDHFRIDIPGPGTVTGQGYDWVRIESIEEVSSQEDDTECITIRVRPATNPKGGGDDVAHFFTDDATSNFMVCRRGRTVTAGVYGRNEKPNTDAEKAVDKARNTMVALSAIAGISKLQWKSLVNGLINA